MLETLTTALRRVTCRRQWKITAQYSSVKFINDRTTGRFRGIAFVEMEDDAAAAKAIAELDGAEFFGRQMVVKEARPPKY